MYRRRRRATLLATLLAVAAILLSGYLLNDGDNPPTSATNPAAAPADVRAPEAATGDRPARREGPVAPTRTDTMEGSSAGDDLPGTSPTPATTAGQFRYAGGPGPLLGTAGPLRQFKVLVESGAGDRAAFAQAVDRILGDPRSWIAGNQYRLQRVTRDAKSEFTIYLASAATSERMCAAGGLNTAGYTSCRLSGKVIINQDRWESAVADYGAPLATYQAYAINHEVGHQLGHGHELCPGLGQPAPVMQQQTYGLKGCTANAWPYLDGKRYAGRRTA